MELIQHLLETDSALPVDERLRTFFSENPDYEVSLVDEGSLSRTYSVEHIEGLLSDMCLITMDAHTLTELADEERFMEEEPMWFTESSHRVSPLFRMRELGEEMGHPNCLCIYVTRSVICNYEDIVAQWDVMDYAVWQCMNIASLEIVPGAEPVALDSYTPPRLPHKCQPGKEPDTSTAFPAPRDEDALTIYLDDETGEYVISSHGSSPMDVESFTGWLLEDLNKMTGLENIKRAMREFADFVIYDELAKYANGGVSPHPDRITKSAVFLGNPGTGKTSVAKLYGTMLYNLGLLKSPEVRVISRQDIINKPYYGAEEQNLHRILDEMEDNGGGVLFIDEAYSLSPEHDLKDPGHLVITSLMHIMDTHPDIALVLAGYTEDMERFLNDNRGLRSRLAGRIFRFEDYGTGALMNIAMSMFTSRNYTLTPTAVTWLEQHIEDAYAARDRHFGNGRFVEKLVERIFTLHAHRIVRMGKYVKSEIMLIKAEDIPLYESGNEKGYYDER